MNIKEKLKKIKLKLVHKYNHKLFNEILKIRNEINIRNNMINNSLIYEKDHHTWIKKSLKDKKKIFYLINISNEIAGMLIVDQIEKIHKRANWAFYLSKKYQNNYGALIEYKFLNIFFKNKIYNKLNCVVLSHNQRVIKLHKKFGFLSEGLLTDYIYRKKKFIDLCMMGIKKERWFEYKIKIDNILNIN
jgi:UDP-4-amino-4,6-dideoxy-N-acetyl-beta-L-altrosamine N-acetyltransferase